MSNESMANYITDTPSEVAESLELNKCRELFPINYVSRKTSISEHTLRAWEKRFRIVKPIRDSNNRRMYSDADLRKLMCLSVLTKSGIPISELADKTVDELSNLCQKDAHAAHYFNRKDERISTLEQIIKGYQVATTDTVDYVHLGELRARFESLPKIK